MPTQSYSDILSTANNLDVTMPGNPPNNYAGITDESRVHKPPGGDTSDIFGLESRQKCKRNRLYPYRQDIESPEADQRYNMKPVEHSGVKDDQKFPSNQNHIQKISPEDEQMFMKVGQHFAQEGQHRLRNIEHDIPLASCMDYAGVTDKTRIRKPPGGDTNDIFDMESRQRSQSDSKQMNLNKFMDMHGHNETNSEILNQEDKKKMECLSDTTLSTNHLNPVSFTESPLFQMDKENLHLLSNASEEDILKKKQLDDEEELKQPAKMYRVRNPITGEVSEMKGSSCSKMNDCSNVVTNPDGRNPEFNRPSVRVRQPPGGVSSNIF